MSSLGEEVKDWLVAIVVAVVLAFVISVFISVIAHSPPTTAKRFDSNSQGILLHLCAMQRPHGNS